MFKFEDLRHAFFPLIFVSSPMIDLTVYTQATAHGPPDHIGARSQHHDFAPWVYGSLLSFVIPFSARCLIQSSALKGYKLVCFAFHFLKQFQGLRVLLPREKGMFSIMRILSSALQPKSYSFFGSLGVCGNATWVHKSFFLQLFKRINLRSCFQKGQLTSITPK